MQQMKGSKMRSRCKPGQRAGPLTTGGQLIWKALCSTRSVPSRKLSGEPFALLAAFVLYRFQTLNTLLWDDSAQVRGGLARAGGSLEAYDKLRTEGQFRELLVEIGSISARPSNFVMNDSEAVYLARFKKSIEQRAGFRNAFTRGAWATGVTMFFSVAAIPVAQYAYCMGACAWLLLVAGILGFGVCLLMYWAIIKAALY